MIRHDPLPRCAGCGLHEPLCLCAEVVRQPSQTQVRLVVHRKEAKKSTNTARLLPLALQDAQISLRGGREPDEPLVLPPDRPALLLFPAPGARSIEAWRGGPPVTLVVPDGNWRQATRAARRVAALADLPRVTLPPGPPSRYRLRNHPDPTRISTFEAVARALAILEPDGAALQAHLDAVFVRFVERSLFTRGQLAAEQVTGGIPDRWNVWPPITEQRPAPDPSDRRTPAPGDRDPPR